MGLDASFTEEIVMALGGWKSGRMRRYAAVTDQTLRAAAEAVSGHESSFTARRRDNRGRQRLPEGPSWHRHWPQRQAEEMLGQ
jgi:hypothetical protein